jgi:valyl-tRNA synthetase
MTEKLAKTYDPQPIEARWYARWVDQGLFHAQASSDRPPFCIVLPPPNITGALHMGHALTATIQDMLVRWRRMQGHNTLWLPGTDHAGIATQTVVERQLRRAGTNRHEIGREAFVDRVWEWREAYGTRIGEQHQRLGASLDWDRERFTLDDGLSRAVREAFVRLYEEGLVYRANRLINWCIDCRTALSDLEVDREEPEPGEMWSFAYPLEDGSGEIVVATTRPETMLGDTAVAVHPEDERYRDLIGSHVRHPFQDRLIPIVGDALLANPELGTGAVKVTPAHDPNDFACGERNGLPQINILNADGTINDEGAPFAGLDRYSARTKVKEELTAKGLFRGRADHQYAPGRCQRCRTVVEPLVSLQWFVNTTPLAEKALAAVRDGRTQFVPKHQEHRYVSWLEQFVPWCISRQLWWGHRIPAWYCDDCEAVTVSRRDPSACENCGSARIRQDEDVLDTWFSSALWPFSTLGWPDETPELATFYPTSVMETGYDIITFWVSRMMMMGIHFMGEVPFRKVLLHPMVRDEEGKKMSKSLGNVIDPLDVIDGIGLEDLIAKTKTYQLPDEELARAEAYQREHFPEGFPRCGTDALRFTLAAYTGQDADIHFSMSRVEGYRRFCNKIWQALRFSLPHVEELQPPATGSAPAPRSLADRWILSRLARVIDEVTAGLEEFRVGEATKTIYQFLWHELCDWYIELSKPTLHGDRGDEARLASQQVLHHTLDAALRLLHPFMPFLTEELWQVLPHRPDNPPSIMVAPWPTASWGQPDGEAEKAMALLQEVVTAGRTIRAQYQVPPSKEVELELHVADETRRQTLQSVEDDLAKQVRVRGPVRIVDRGERPRGAAVAVAGDVEVYMPLQGLIDAAAEKKRLEKELARVTKEQKRCQGKLSNEKFLARAPAEVVDKERHRCDDLTIQQTKLAEALRRIEELT